MKLKKSSLMIFTGVLIGSIVLAVGAYQLQPPASIRLVETKHPHLGSATPPARITPTAVPTPAASLTATPSSAPALNPSSVLGIDSGPPSSFPGIAWTRINYPTCGSSRLTGASLRGAIQLNHLQGVHVLLLFCQHPGALLFDMRSINDVAQSGADAVDCGNEQMKYNTYPTYVSPGDFARFFDLCERAVHAIRPGIPVLLGSLDPQVGGVDYQPLYNQLGYLDAVEYAMNTAVHPGGHWSWRSHIIGLIDSWHNGFPDQSVNSLRALFFFWAQQFGVDVNSGALGQHLWVVEGTGCVYGCGLGSYYDISVAHVLTLITDVETAISYHVPFFYFSGRDFFQQGNAFWPMGVLDVNGHPKPLRQDLSMGARVLVMSCSTGQVQVVDQEQLLAKLYSGCTLPGDYASILAG